MTVATDPKIEQTDDSDDGFAKHFEEFATGKPAPNSEEPSEPGEPEGNGPEGEPAAPAEDKPTAATEEGEPADDATSGDAKPDGGGQPPSDQAPDPFAELPDEIKAKIAEIEKERDEARHKAQSDASRVAALSRKLQQLSTATTASAPAAPADEPSEAQKALDEKIKQLKEDYGDIAEPLVELIEQQRSELSTVRKTLDGLSAERQQQVIATETQALEARHPDWRDIAQSPDFGAWLAIQPPNIQGLAESWDARETSVVLTLFKAEKVEATGQTDQKPAVATDQKPDAATGKRRSQQLDGGADVRSKPAPAASEAPDDFEAAFEFYRQKQEQKRLAQTR